MGKSKDIPLEDFYSESSPFTLPGGPQLQGLIAQSPDFISFGKSQDGSVLWLSKQGALDALLRANLRAVHSGNFTFSAHEMCRRAGWPEIDLNPDAFVRVLKWGQESSLLSFTADRRRGILVLGAFLADVAATVSDSAIRPFLVDRCVEFLRKGEFTGPAPSPFEAIERFGQLDRRAGEILGLRSGLTNGKPLTLEVVGKKLGITRERVRQIESRSRNKWQWRQLCADMLVRDFFHHKGTRTAVETSPRKGVWQFAEFILGVALSEVGRPRLYILGVSQKRQDAIGWNHWGYDELFLGGGRRKLDALNMGLPSEDLNALSAAICNLRKRSMQRIGQVICALERIGRPAHYSEIAVIRNELFPDSPMPDRNVHVTLGLTKDVAFAGRRGVYGLKRWGVEAPAQHLDKQVIGVLEKLYRIIGAPVPFKTVLSHVRRERTEADETSVQIILSMNCDKMPDQKWRPRLKKIKKSPGNTVPIQSSRYFRPRS